MGVMKMVMKTKHKATFATLALVGMMLAAPALAGDSSDDERSGMGILFEKSDPLLQEQLLEGKRTGFEVILTGWPHEDVGGLAAMSRADAMVELEARSQPFFQSVHSMATESDGIVLRTWASAPAMKVLVDLPLLKDLAQQDSIRFIVADAPDAVQLIEPFEDNSGPGAMNTEGRHMIQAEELWDLGYRGEGITVSVIDTGIDPDHEAFKNADGSTRIEKFSDCVSGGCDDTVEPYDDHGHGAHVAGTVLGTNLYDDPEWGRYQEVGVAPEATLYVSKFLGGGGGGSWEGGIDSLQWSFDVGADITSNSWGGNCQSSLPVVQVVNQLSQLGMLNVFAAGNSGTWAYLGPACADTALGVGAVDGNYNIAGFSSRGPCEDPDTKSGQRICPDVVAKGVAVRSAIPRSGATWGDPSGYRVWQGTSMATPHVAGAAALIEQMKRDLTGSGWDTVAEEEKAIFKDTALDLGTPGPDNTYGWGHVELAPIAAMLDPTDGARLVTGLTVQNSEIRLNEDTFLRFHVRNLGNAEASGSFSAQLVAPDGSIVWSESSSVSLGFLENTETSHTFSTSDPEQRGTYTLRGQYALTWTDPDTGGIVEQILEREDTFVVRAVVMDVALDGLDEYTMVGNIQEVSWSAENVGNDVAQNVRLEFTVPFGYEFVPGDNFDPLVEESRYADPTPDSVDHPLLGAATLIFEVGEVAPGDSFSFTANLLPLVPDEYELESLFRFEDGIGQSLTMTDTHAQEAGLLP